MHADYGKLSQNKIFALLEGTFRLLSFRDAIYGIARQISEPILDDMHLIFVNHDLLKHFFKNGVLPATYRKILRQGGISVSNL